MKTKTKGAPLTTYADAAVALGLTTEAGRDAWLAQAKANPRAAVDAVAAAALAAPVRRTPAATGTGTGLHAAAGAMYPAAWGREVGGQARAGGMKTPRGRLAKAGVRIAATIRSKSETPARIAEARDAELHRIAATQAGRMNRHNDGRV